MFLTDILTTYGREAHLSTGVPDQGFSFIPLHSAFVSKGGRVGCLQKEVGEGIIFV